MIRGAILCASLLTAGPADAAVRVVRGVAVVADGVGALGPRHVPGAVIEVSLTLDNPLLTLDRIADLVVCDTLSDTAVLLTADLDPGGGPVAVEQSLIGSGLSYRFAALGAPDDGLAFFDAAGRPLDPTSGEDARVRRLCVTLAGARMAAGGGVRLRYRLRLR